MTLAAWQSCYVLGLDDGPSVWNALLSKLQTFDLLYRQLQTYQYY